MRTAGRVNSRALADSSRGAENDILDFASACAERGGLMELFYAPGSSSLFPHIVLHEAGLAFEAIKIDEHTKIISDGGDYRSVNPLGYVPALLLDGGTLLTEGAAIVQYIADLVPGKKLAPPNGTIERVAWRRT